MNDLPIVKILQAGISGLAFLLAYLGYRLLRKEQDKAEPDERILKSVHAFMLICVILAVLVGSIELIKLFASTSSDMGASRLQATLRVKDETITSLTMQIRDLESLSVILQEKQVTLDQKIDLGLYYTLPVSEDRIEKRDSKKALEYLISALKVHDSDLNEPRKAEIVKGLVRIREKITRDEDFTFLLQKIEEYRYGIEKELDIAKVYWAFANSTSRMIVKRRSKSLEHFLEAASRFENDIAAYDKRDIITLIEVLKKNDPYLNKYGDKVIRSIEESDKQKTGEYLESWNDARDSSR